MSKLMKEIQYIRDEDDSDISYLIEFPSAVNTKGWKELIISQMELIQRAHHFPYVIQNSVKGEYFITFDDDTDEREVKGILHSVQEELASWY